MSPSGRGETELLKKLANAYDEMSDSTGVAREAYTQVRAWLDTTPPELLQIRSAQAELLFKQIGVTFNVYGDAGGLERLIPFDVVPRVISSAEWPNIEQGLVQRVEVLNALLLDLYSGQEVLKAGIIPDDLVNLNPQFELSVLGHRPAKGVFVHIAGIDLVRTGADDFMVLEDNARTPSGVSYMLENREVMLRLFPELVTSSNVAPVETYPDLLLETLQSVAPDGNEAEPTVVVLTPGAYNAAFYEHSFLAEQMGVELVEGADLFVQDSFVYMRTIAGARRVHVIYRRIDDAYLDPLFFRPESTLGVPGLLPAYLAGNVALVNAIGTGVADNKAIYSYMPELIRFYSGRDPILPNVPTWRCREADHLSYVMDHLSELVVKEVDGSGGYGILIGPQATKAEISQFAAKLHAHPDGFIAQPTLALSTCPTLHEGRIESRHVDFRPFVLTGANGVKVIPGGLTRVALEPGSLVVNSSQGGGTKDTWVAGC